MAGPVPVTALLAAGDRDLEAAVAAQTARPEDVRTTGAVLDAAAGAEREGAPWLWLLDGSAAPREDALERLLDGLEQAPPGPRCVLLAAKLLDERGELAVGRAPWYRRGEPDLVMRAAVRHLLPVRAAHGGCLLVRRDAAAGAGAPLARLNGPGAMLEWTARLLRRDAGYLVPGAIATVRAGDRDPVEDLHAGAALVASRAFGAKERLWLAPEVVGQARAARRGGAARGQIASAGAAGALAAVRGRASARARGRP